LTAGLQEYSSTRTSSEEGIAKEKNTYDEEEIRGGAEHISAKGPK
jgi:hypothetical protein